jgi:hypothetical protein
MLSSSGENGISSFLHGSHGAMVIGPIESFLWYLYNTTWYQNTISFLTGNNSCAARHEVFSLGVSVAGGLHQSHGSSWKCCTTYSGASLIGSMVGGRDSPVCGLRCCGVETRSLLGLYSVAHQDTFARGTEHVVYQSNSILSIVLAAGASGISASRFGSSRRRVYQREKNDEGG